MLKKEVISIEDLLKMNEVMLGRGVPNQEDGIGYNKADYGACSNYFYGLSNAQIADLAKRLVKYSNTQLQKDRETMKETARYYASLVNNKYDRTDGISLNITEGGTLISFRYNTLFIETIKAQPMRRWDAQNKQWIVPNSSAMSTLRSLKEVGADVDNAILYARSILINKPKIP